MKVTSQKKKTLDPRTGASLVIEDKSMKTNMKMEEKNDRMTRPERDAYMEKLERNVIDAQYDISDFIKQYNNWSNNPMVIRNQADVATFMYCKQLDMLCMEQLAKGIDKRNIAETIGMSIGMRLASKEYNQYKKAQRAEKKMESREKWVSRAEKLADSPFKILSENGEILQEGISVPGAKAFKKFAEWRRDQNIKQAHGGIMPMTQEGAAITYIGLAKSAYQDMRKPEADVDAVYEKFKTAKDCLYEQARYENISPAQLNKQVRDIVGKMADKYPDMTIFEEMSKGDVDFKDGKFINIEEGTEFDGRLEPRKPWTKEKYKETLHKYYEDLYSKCDNVREINNVDYEKTGFAEKMDTLRTQYCSDFGQNKEDMLKVTEEFNQMYSSAAVVKLHDWASNSKERQDELDAYFTHMKQKYAPTKEEQPEKKAEYKTASEMISPEMYEIAGIDNYDNNGYSLER